MNRHRVVKRQGTAMGTDKTPKTKQPRGREENSHCPDASPSQTPLSLQPSLLRKKLLQAALSWQFCAASTACSPGFAPYSIALLRVGRTVTEYRRLV
jgi:hypothetical protein